MTTRPHNKAAVCLKPGWRDYMARSAMVLRLVCILFLSTYLFQTLDFSSAQAQELESQRDETEERLRELQSQINLGEEKKQELSEEIAALEQDRATLNRELIDTSARTRELESRIDRSGARLTQLLNEENETRSSLRARRDVLAEVLAALQRMGRKPPPALLVNPEDALSSVRSAILLGSVVPEIRQETEILLAELQNLVRIREEVEVQTNELTSDLNRLAEEEERLNLLLSQKAENVNKARSALLEESRRAAELAAEANNLGRLIETLETEIASAREAAEAARNAEEARKAQEAERIETAREAIEKPDFSDTGRIAPAVAFSKTKGLLSRPVNGVEITRFGQKDNFGVEAAGASIATRNNARVIAPADGWVVYAGPFRSYGQLLILNAGDDHHLVFAGMERINVQLGQFVLAGEPIGQMGSQRIASTGGVDVASTRPILYVEFRKDGQSIDPGPWWAPNRTESGTDGS